MSTSIIFGQTSSPAFAPIKEHLERWDDIRGAWLAAAIQALAANKQVPDRTFPEDFTPYELLSMLPVKRAARLTSNGARESARSHNEQPKYGHRLIQCYARTHLL